MNQQTEQGIAAIKLGDFTAARRLLAAAIKQDPNDLMAWLWLTGATNNDQERMDCLRQVLRIDPQNQAAARGLAQILERQAIQSPPVPAITIAPTTVAPTIVTPPTVAPTSVAPPPPAIPQTFPPVPQAEPQPVVLAPAESLSETGPQPGQAAIDAMRESVQAVQPEEDLEPEAASSLPTEAVQAFEPTVTPQPTHRWYARPAAAENAQLIFRSRPSVVPALICLWLFMFGAIGVASLLKDVPELSLPIAGGLGFVLELVVLYAIIRGLSERYELTTQQLTLRFRGKRARIPVPYIYNAELTQSSFQRLLGVGNIEIDAAVDGQLTHLRMRNVPQSRQRTDQIMKLVNEHAST